MSDVHHMLQSGTLSYSAKSKIAKKLHLVSTVFNTDTNEILILAIVTSPIQLLRDKT